MVKRPPGYLLSLSCLSNHLQMRWQVTPAATVTRKVIPIPIAFTSSRCRVSVGQRNDYNMSQNKMEHFKLPIATQICPCYTFIHRGNYMLIVMNNTPWFLANNQGTLSFSSLIPPLQNPQKFLSPSSFLCINITKIQRRQYSEPTGQKRRKGNPNHLPHSLKPHLLNSPFSAIIRIFSFYDAFIL